MSLHVSPLEALLAGAVLIVGLFWYWRMRWTTIPPTHGLDSFFLGDGKVGAELTKHNNWGLCFAFANALWYFAFLGYSYGLWSFLFQIPWSASVVLLTFLLPTYLRASKKGTVHGFLGYIYSPRVLRLAAMTTVFGYILNCGFELYYSMHLLAVALDISGLVTVLSVGLALFVAAYCAMGGYYANAMTDKWKNLLGLGAALLLIALLSLAHWRATGQVMPLYISGASAAFSTPSWPFIIGVSIFAFFFNFVDMANWQSLAATREATDADQKKVQRGLIMSAIYQMGAPALLGTWLGLLLRGLRTSLADERYFAAAFGDALSPLQSIPIVSGLILGALLLGFVSMTIASADSYLLAAVQTLCVDMFRRQTLIATKYSADAQASAIVWSRRALFILAVVMVSVFALLFRYLKAEVFDLQFAMYGAAITLLPIVAVGLLPTETAPSSAWALASVAAGLFAVLCPFIVATFMWTSIGGIRGAFPRLFADRSALIHLAPAAGLFFSSVVCGVGWWRYPVRKDRDRAK